MTEEIKTKSVPSLGTLYFYLTGDCNMACRHCWIAPTFYNGDQSEKGLPYDTFVSIITEARELGLHSVKLTGGEPLIHPDIIRIIRYIRDQGLGLTIETNGVAITPHIADLIKSCRTHFISVSIDGLKESHEWMRGVPGSFERASTGMKTLVETGIHPQIIMAVAEKNKHEIAELAGHKFCEDAYASGVFPLTRLSDELIRD
ncbi:MAG: radical SAM protein [Methanobacteriota archaeon]